MRYLICILLIVSVKITFCQKVNITGRCVDSVRQPLSFATIKMFRAGTITAIAQALTDSSGVFNFLVETPSVYFIQAEALGFIMHTSKSITVADTSKNIQLPDFIMYHAVAKLNNVTVTNTKPLISAVNEKIVYNVEEDKSLNGLTTLDALARVPFVSVDGLGNVQLKGQTNFRILLNGRPTSLFANSPGDALKGFPANSVSKIEVITSPSAKYEGEGLSGLINIITQKKTIGFNGSTSFTYSNIQDGAINPNNRISFKSGKIGVNSFMYYAENLGFQTTGFNEYTALRNSSLFYRRRSADTLQNRAYQYGGNLEIAYDIDSLQSLSIYGVLFGSGSKRRQTNRFVLSNTAGSSTGFSNFFTFDTSVNPGSEFGIDYIKKFAKAGKEFSLSANRQFRRNSGDLFSDQIYSSGNLLFLKNNNRATNEQNTVQADFVLPSGTLSSWESGINIIQRSVASDYSSFFRNKPTDPFSLTIGNNDILEYKQWVLGGYLVYNYNYKVFSMKIGSRVERTIVEGDFVSAQTKVRQDYLSLLPNATFNWKFKGNYRLNLGYNRRLSRPSLVFLNPFTDNRDPLFLSFGNPSLEPEFSNNFELGVSVFKQKFSYSFNFSSSFIDDGIQRYFTFNESTGVTTQTYGNVGLSRVFSINGFGTYRPTKKFNYSLNYGINYASFKNNVQPTEKNSGWYGNINHSVNYIPNPRFFFFHTFNYTGAPLQLQGRNANLLSYNVGMGYYPIPQKLVISLGVNNFLKETLSLNSRFASSTFLQLVNVERPIRSISITIRYNYGKLKQSVSRKKGVQIDDSKENVNSQ